MEVRKMRRIVVLGGGTAGTIVVTKLRRRLDAAQWEIAVVDRDDIHRYQPGYLFLPFGRYQPADVARSRHAYIPDGVRLVLADVERVVPERHSVLLADGSSLDYDYLVVATGVQPRPDQTPGLLGDDWRRGIHEFYTYEGALALADALAGFERGRLVVHIVDMPIKCPVAPLEFAFLADAFLADRGRRDRVELTYVTPLPDAFTQPVAAAHLSGMLTERGIGLETDFMVEQVRDRTLVSYDEREIPFDLLVTVPLNMGAEYVARSGLGDELNYVPVDRHTLRSPTHPDIFAIGDANDLPTSKAGSVAHFSADIVIENLLSAIDGRPLKASFDGHANCFVESGRGKGLLLDFNYDTQPLPGKYPVPRVGPFSLLAESRANHLGKLGFRWAYWNLLLRGRPMPVPARMSMAGKDREPADEPVTTGR
jgi:sulfide:quinone oxidoreductase